MLHCSYLCTVTDFGICASDMLGNEGTVPEVRRSLLKYEMPSFTEPARLRHILCYDLPGFCRDPFTVLRWCAFPKEQGLPPAPSSAAAWALDGLRYLEEHKSELQDASGWPLLARHVFATSARPHLGEVPRCSTCFLDDQVAQRMQVEGAHCLREERIAPKGQLEEEEGSCG